MAVEEAAAVEEPVVETPEPVESPQTTDNGLDLDHWTKVIDEAAGDDEPEEATEPDQGARLRGADGRFLPKDAPAKESAETPAAEPETPPADDAALTELREQAQAYGLTEDDYGGLDTAAMERLLKVLDRQTMAQGKQALAQQQAEQPAEKPAEPPKPETKPAEAPRPGDHDFTAYLKELREAGYEDVLLKPLEAMHAQLTAAQAKLEAADRLAQQSQQSQAEAQQQAEYTQFYTLLDALNMPELFGTEEKATPEQQQNIRKLFDTTYTLRVGLAQTGRDPALSKAVVQRALAAEFSEHLSQKALAAKTAALQKQGMRRMGSGQAPAPRKDLPFDGDPADDPEIKAFFARVRAENEGRR